jgi:hypothetical protein
VQIVPLVLLQHLVLAKTSELEPIIHTAITPALTTQLAVALVKMANTTDDVSYLAELDAQIFSVSFIFTFLCKYL